MSRTIRIAFAGASGTGKSTLAQFVSEHYGVPVNPVGSRSVAAEMGFTSPYDVDQAGKRSEFQHRLLRAKVTWEAERESFVTDRSTCDQLLYWMLHDVRSVGDASLDLVKVGMLRYTHVAYCPVDRFRSREADAARVTDETYHAVYDAALIGLLAKYTETSRLWELKSGDLEERKDEVLAMIKGIR